MIPMGTTAVAGKFRASSDRGYRVRVEALNYKGLWAPLLMIRDWLQGVEEAIRKGCETYLGFSCGNVQGCAVARA